MYMLRSWYTNGSKNLTSSNNMEPSTLNLDSFSPKKAELVALATELRPTLNITIVDKKTYDMVHSAEMKLASARITTEKQGKALREDAVLFQRAVLDRQKELLAEITPIEDELKAKKKAYNDEQDRIKQEDINRKERVLNDRIVQLSQYNFTPNIITIQDMSNETFGKLLDDVKVDFEEAEKIRITQIESDRIAREQLIADQKKLEDDKRTFEEEQRIARQAQTDKDNESRRVAQLEQARLQGIKDAEEKAKRDTLQAEVTARENQARLEKKKKYQAFCELHGYHEGNKEGFRLIPEGNTIVLCRVLWIFTK